MVDKEPKEAMETWLQSKSDIKGTVKWRFHRHLRASAARICYDKACYCFI